MLGFFCLHLHSHMPYVRKNGVFPVGEDWLYQVMSDTYIPLLDLLFRLHNRGISDCLSLTVTPVLCEQLVDNHIKMKFLEYLDTMKARSLSDREDFIYFGDEIRKQLAERYYLEFDSKKQFFQLIDTDLIGALRELQRKGVIEIVSSSATHAFLPGFENPEALKSQIKTGIETYRHHFDNNPSGFWLPECAYRKGVEKILESEGIQYVILDSSSLGSRNSHRAYLIGDSSVAAIARNELTHQLVWDDIQGYPSCRNYLDSTKYYQSSGLRYWKVTGHEVPIEEKAVYDIEAAARDIEAHAFDFFEQISQELKNATRTQESRHQNKEAEFQTFTTLLLPNQNGENKHVHSVESEKPVASKPLVLAAYDTELFGHGWREGITWIDSLFKFVEKNPRIQVATPHSYLHNNEPEQKIQPDETTWGTNSDSSTWINESTAWMWEKINSSRQKFNKFLSQKTRRITVLEERLLKQAARELLLLESSDWPYMVAKNRAREYATQRFDTHLKRFNQIMHSLKVGVTDETIKTLEKIEKTDKIFVWAGLELLSGSGLRSEGSRTCGY